MGRVRKQKAATSLNISRLHTTEEKKEILILGPKFSEKPPKYDEGYLTFGF
jgi:hypothetical protein